VKVAHFLAGCAVALVDADGPCGGFVDWGKLEFYLVLDVAAVAGSGIGFEFGHIEKAVCSWSWKWNWNVYVLLLWSKAVEAIIRTKCGVRVRQQRFRRFG